MATDNNPNDSSMDSQGAQIPPVIEDQHTRTLTENGYEPMNKTGLLAALEALLKHPKRVIFQLHQDNQATLITWLFAITTLCALAYGLVVGSFSGGQQLWAASAKVTAAILVSAAFCLPSLYIFACLNGVEVKISEVCGFLCATVALTSILLIGFAPVAWLFSESTNSAVFMGTLHLVFWAIGMWFGLRLLYMGLSYVQSTHMNHLHVWAVIFVLVCLQMTTTLRPIVGTADTFLPVNKKFFLVHWWECLD